MSRWRAFLRKLEVPQRDEEVEVWQNSRWLNRDNVPLPPDRRTWGPWTYIALWTTTGINISGWTGAASLLSLGLNVGQAMAVVVIGHVLIACVVILTGLVGAKWHVGFPMWNRMTWGMRASWFPLLNRIILSFTWSATQGWFGGQMIKTLLGSLRPSIHLTPVPNTFPISSHLTSADFLCFWVFIIISIPILWIPPEKLQRPFMVVAASSTTCCLAIFIWSLSQGHGVGPLVSGNTSQLVGVTPVQGSALAWAMFYGTSSQLGTLCASILNMSDYTRFAKRPGNPVISQAIIVPIVGTITCFVGIVSTSVAVDLYPGNGLLWAPYLLLHQIQANGGAGARAAVFFASLAFVLAQFGINIASNAISGGIDLASLLPRYLNIRRGAIITTLMALPMCPWALTAGASVYISVMAGYATFIAPMTGLMVSDYLFVRRSRVKLSALYVGDRESIYWYYRGVNWRAPVAWILGVAPSFPGFLTTVSSVNLPFGYVHAFHLCFPVGFFVGGGTYLLLTRVWPIPNAGEVDEFDIYGSFGEPGLPYNASPAFLGAIDDFRLSRKVPEVPQMPDAVEDEMDQDKEIKSTTVAVS